MASDLAAQIIETWAIHNRINLFLLNAIPPEALDAVSASKGRSIGAEFAHIHNVRLMWLKASAPNLLEGLTKFEAKEPVTKEQLHAALGSSGRATESLLTAGLAVGKIKNFKPHPVAFLGYLISHESYHRAEIGIILTQSGHKLDDKIAYGQWEWGVR
jgi:uncharacterized damage-inducible protein DinB